MTDARRQIECLPNIRNDIRLEVVSRMNLPLGGVFGKVSEMELRIGFDVLASLWVL